VSEKKIVPDTEMGALLHIIVRYPPPSPPLLPTILRNIFPHDPLYCNKILAISCKGQLRNSKQFTPGAGEGGDRS